MVRRLFFALTPKPEVSQQLQQWQQTLSTCAGQPILPAKLHLTLLFLGEVPEVQTQAIREIAPGVTGPRFNLTLDTVGCFRKNRILWAGLSQPPAALLELHQKIRQALRPLVLPLETEPYRPHVTLYRKASKQPPVTEGRKICWAVDDYRLLESTSGDAGGHYATVMHQQLV